MAIVLVLSALLSSGCMAFWVTTTASRRLRLIIETDLAGDGETLQAAPRRVIFPKPSDIPSGVLHPDETAVILTDDDPTAPMMLLAVKDLPYPELMAFLPNINAETPESLRGLWLYEHSTVQDAQKMSFGDLWLAAMDALDPKASKRSLVKAVPMVGRVHFQGAQGEYRKVHWDLSAVVDGEEKKFRARWERK